MATDTKRAAGDKRWLVLVNLGTDNAKLADLHETLAAHGLHVVTAADKSELAQLREKVAKAIYMLENYDLSGSMLALEVLRGS